jgi:hypothetical protein
MLQIIERGGGCYSEEAGERWGNHSRSWYGVTYLINEREGSRNHPFYSPRVFKFSTKVNYLQNITKKLRTDFEIEPWQNASNGKAKGLRKNRMEKIFMPKILFILYRYIMNSLYKMPKLYFYCNCNKLLKWRSYMAEIVFLSCSPYDSLCSKCEYTEYL